MFGSSTIELALGMAFVYLSLSLVVSAVREGIEARLKTRAQHLARGIAQLLMTPAAAELIYAHPLIASLYDSNAAAGPAKADAGSAETSPHPGETAASGWKGFLDSWLFGRSTKAGQQLPNAIHQGAFTGQNFFLAIPLLVRSLFTDSRLPSYIPKRSFAMALLQMVRETDPAKNILPHAAPATGFVAPGPGNAVSAVLPTGVPANPTLVDEVRQVLDANKDNPLAQAISAVLADSGSNVDKALDAITAWFDGTMDRVSGWYKRESQHIMFWLGIVVAIGLNVDSVFLVK